ncbi:hypothetical protein AG0111_0g11706 [Alternaria gaisen]|uniref:Uncharacterized protein n=1 Tax=Alternaria gaisen TaxID=167740 RepID=A0ACB6F6M5_9PLEO|nr:hypothetical protein AG0111_0g11706 [Alternaria gaisen]
MALSIIKQRIAYYGAGDLIAALPAHDSMKWVSHSVAAPPEALVIGTCDGRDILAFMGERWWQPTQAPSLAPDEVVKLPLDAPFRYSADTSEAGKRNLDIVVQWYFMNTIEPDVDYVEYCPQFYKALQDIDAKKRAEGESGTPEPEAPRERARPTFKSPRSSQPRSKVTKQLVTPDKSSGRCPLVSMGGDEHTDLDTLHDYLDEVRFVHQDFFLDAQPRKLFVGYHKEHGNDIYAYMRKPREYHRIEFYIEDTHALSRTVIRSEDVAKQRILHPFNKTYLESAHRIGQDEKARLTLMVKWYFIAAGVAKNCVLRETKAFPERLRSALEYIAERMGAASARPPSIDCERQSEPRTTPEEASPAIDESPVQPTTAEITTDLLSPPSTSTIASPRRSTAYADQLNDEVNAVDTSILRLTKRTADDAEFEDLAGIVLEVLATDQNLTSQIGDIDKRIGTLHTQRRELVERRKQVKRKFTKQTLAIASRMDE